MPQCPHPITPWIRQCTIIHSVPHMSHSSHICYLASIPQSSSGVHISTFAHSPSVLGTAILHVLNDFQLITEQEIMENAAPSGWMVDQFQTHQIGHPTVATYITLPAYPKATLVSTFLPLYTHHLFWERQFFASSMISSSSQSKKSWRMWHHLAEQLTSSKWTG